MLQIVCEGTPLQIGLQHGREAKTLVHDSIQFYAGLFERQSKQQWTDVRKTASMFSEFLQDKFPLLHEELEGLAQGAEKDILDIVALNCRTEIAFGQMHDGCTSLAWKTGEHFFLAQNWDWMSAQKRNLVHLTINKPDGRRISMITEAGIIGKIGFNSDGVGVCMNAIRARGVSYQKLPVHLSMRLVLESRDAAEATGKLQEVGIASAVHLLVADATESYSIEATSEENIVLRPDLHGRLYHTNHLVASFRGELKMSWLPDSENRLHRVSELADALLEKTKKSGLGWEEIFGILQDEKDLPAAICRQEEGISHAATLFSVVMELRKRVWVVKVGRPTSPDLVI